MKIRMINSVGEYAAGEDYEIESDLGDIFILRGYADGALSRAYAPEEKEELAAGVQVVSLGG